MARRLTTNQEIAGSIPASITSECSSVEEYIPFAFVDSNMLEYIFGSFWLGATTSSVRIDMRLDLYERHGTELSFQLLNVSIHPYLVTGDLLKRRGGICWDRYWGTP
jgi:hypothetical protein